MRVWGVAAILAVVVLPAFGQEETFFRVKARNNLGVPLHSTAGDARVSGRLPEGTIVKQIAVDADTGWIEVEAPDATGWITTRYRGEAVQGGTEGEAPAVEYVIGCWNLEHFHDGAKRGFPEYTRGGPTYPARTDGDYEYIASIIEDLGVKVLALSEIFAEERLIVDGDEQYMDVRSAELDKLVAAIDSDNYDYTMG